MNIEQAQKTLKEHGYILGALFQLEDIKQEAESLGYELSGQVVKEIADRIEDNFEIVSFEVIQSYVQTYAEENGLESMEE